MHEIIRLFAEGVGKAPPGSDNSVKIAIITAISVVLAAAITAFATTLTRHHRSETDDFQEYVDELIRRAEVAERQAARLESRNDSLCARVDDLERYCWRAGIDPNTGEPVAPVHGGGG